MAVVSHYEQYMVPMVFEPYAEDLAVRLKNELSGAILEVAAGTGIVTRKLDPAISKSGGAITVTDISADMLELGRKLCPGERSVWETADAHQLPYIDRSFDLVVCQFGAMFFKDRVKAFREARRVLTPGGKFIFSVWDRIEENDFANTVSETAAKLMPSDPPTFLSRVPHGYYDRDQIVSDLKDGGFTAPMSVDVVARQSYAPHAGIVAQALTQGTPLRAEIETRMPGRSDEATKAAETALVEKFGAGRVTGRLKAFVVSVSRTG
jgi:SAM-dependent methyltransferase